MKKLYIGLAAFLLVGLWFTPAHAVSCVGAGDVTALSSCSDDGVTFSNFSVSAVGFTSAAVFIGNAAAGTQILPGSVNLGFQTSQTPTPQTGLADIILKYTVTAAAPILTGINLANGGTNVTIQEKVCQAAFVAGACAAGLLANLIVPSDSIAGTSTFATPVASYNVFKDLQFVGSPTSPAFLSDFTNSHETAPSPTPEPATLLLVGTVLTALGWRLRRR